MRALGRGSVSSFLKVILDVFHVVLWVAIAAVTIFVLAALLLSFRPELTGGPITIDHQRIDGPWFGPFAAAAGVAGDLYLAGAIVIVGRLRQIFQTLIAGDPFHPDNVARLRTVALTLAVLELGRYGAAALARMFGHGHLHWSGGVSLTTWFAVLVIVVLSEVFREGARLRGEAELTI
jgi:hypothetical protein